MHEGRVSFFFQAEDGIRDIGVTGVQTCALPICAPPRTRAARSTRRTDDRVAARQRDASVNGLDEQLRRAAVAALGRALVDRKSVGAGKRVALGGRRLYKTKQNVSHTITTTRTQR